MGSLELAPALDERVQFDGTAPPWTRRPATAGDEQFLKDLYASTRDDLVASGLAPAAVAAVCEMQWRAQRAGYADRYPRARDEVLVVAGEPVGRLLTDVRDDEVVVVDVALVPVCRGHGIGRELLRQVQREAATDGRAVRLHVLVDSPARRLYDRMGFRPTGSDGVRDELPVDAVSLADVSRDDFARVEGSAFSLGDPPGLELELAEVSPRVVNGPWESFSLRFRGPAEPVLGQGQHVLVHRELGSLELFLVPMQPDASGPSYDCVFNRSATVLAEEG